MFLDSAKPYFEYMSKHLYHSLPSILVKIVGTYQLVLRDSVTGKSTSHFLVVMEDLFYDRNITKVFDLKGSDRNRLASEKEGESKTLLDQNFRLYTGGYPLFLQVFIICIII